MRANYGVVKTMSLAERIKAKQKEVQTTKAEIRKRLMELPTGLYRVSLNLSTEIEFFVERTWYKIFDGVNADLIINGSRKASTEWTPFEVNLVYGYLDEIMKKVEEKYAE